MSSIERDCRSVTAIAHRPRRCPGRAGFPTEGQAIVHLIARAALEGVLCLGPDRDGKPTYVLFDDWVARGEVSARESALAELARRYFTAYGPADLDDFATWSGLPRGDARSGWQRIAGDLAEVAIDGRPAWLPKTHLAWLGEPPSDTPVARLVPAFDTYLLGYRGRELAVAPAYAKRVHPDGGMLRPMLLVDGRALGIWRSRRVREGVEVTVDPFVELGPNVRSAIEAEAADVCRFLGVYS